MSDNPIDYTISRNAEGIGIETIDGKAQGLAAANKNLVLTADLEGNNLILTPKAFSALRTDNLTLKFQENQKVTSTTKDSSGNIIGEESYETELVERHIDLPDGKNLTLNVQNVDRFEITTEAAAKLNPNAHFSDHDILGIDPDTGAIIITNDTGEVSSISEKLSNPMVFSFEHETLGTTQAVLNDVSDTLVPLKGPEGPRVETLVVGNVEIDFGNRMRRYNELVTQAIQEAGEEIIPAIPQEASAILIGIHQEIRSGIVDAHKTLNSDMQQTREVTPAQALTND